MTKDNLYKTKKKNNKMLIYLSIGAVVLVVLLIILKKTNVIGDGNNIEVEVSKVEKRTIVETITASGKLQPEKEVAISADVSGEIIELNFIEGEKVKKGDLLLRIKPDEYVSNLEDARASYNSSLAALENSKAQLLQSEAILNKNKKLLDRYKKLKEKNAVSSTEFERVNTEYLSANAQYKSAKLNIKTSKYQIVRAKAARQKAEENLRKTSIFSPIAGVVTILNKELGERVVGTNLMEGSIIMKIADLNNMEVSVDVNENDIIRLEIGDTAEIEIDAFIDKKFKGLVTEIANSSVASQNFSEQITTFEVKIRLLKESYQDLLDTVKSVSTPFRPGMSAMVDVRTKTSKQILSVPILSVTTRDLNKLKQDKDSDKKSKDKKKKENYSDNESKKEVVFLFVDGKAKITPVKIGIQDDYYIEIKSGLTEGQKVISGPYSTISKILKDDMNISEQKKDDE